MTVSGIPEDDQGRSENNRSGRGDSSSEGWSRNNDDFGDLDSQMKTGRFLSMKSLPSRGWMVRS